MGASYGSKVDKRNPLKVLIWLPSLLQDIMVSNFSRPLFLGIYSPSSENLRVACEQARNMRRLAEHTVKKGKA